MKESLQAKIDLPLTWHNPEESKSAKIFVRKDADFTDRSQWQGQIEWLAMYLKKFTEVFGPVAKNL
jgi:hypothetical protein